MPTLQNKENLKRFLGFVTYLTKFILNISEPAAKNDILLDWHPAHEQAFSKLKEQSCNCDDVSWQVEIQCDASQDVLGCSANSRRSTSC